MIREPSRLLKRLLSDWLLWATAPILWSEPPRFSTEYGLCENFPDSVNKQLRQLFIDDGLSPYYPFGEQNFWEREINRTQHEDPARLAWVRKILKVAP